MLPRWLVVSLFLGFSALASQPFAFSQASGCSQTEIRRTTGDVEAARKALLALPVGSPPQTDLSPDAQEAVAAMKNRLAEFLDTYMQCVPLDNPDAKLIQGQLASLTNAYQIPPGTFTSVKDTPKDSFNYGYQLWFDVKTTDDSRHLVSIVASFQIECGEDAMLIVFAPKDKSWRQVIRYQSQPYKDVSGALWSFDYGISPPDESGRWYVVTKYINPWCSSTWSSINYSVLRVGVESHEPSKIFSDSASIWWGGDDYGTLVVDRDQFDLRFHAESIDAGVHNRTWVRHYRIKSDTIVKSQPVAASPMGFVEEWLVTPWPDASGWSSPKEKSNLQGIHAIPTRGLSYDSVRKCSDAADHYQVVLADEGNRLFYFQVVGKDTYQMQNASTSPDPRCKGRDLLGLMTP